MQKRFNLSSNVSYTKKGRKNLNLLNRSTALELKSLLISWLMASSMLCLTVRLGNPSCRSLSHKAFLHSMPWFVSWSQAKTLQAVGTLLSKGESWLSRHFSSPVLTWAAVNRMADECKIPQNQKTAAVKFCEELGPSSTPFLRWRDLGHILYFPGIEDQKKRIKSVLADATSGIQLNQNGFVIHDLSYVTALITGILDRKNQQFAQNGRHDRHSPLYLSQV